MDEDDMVSAQGSEAPKKQANEKAGDVSEGEGKGKKGAAAAEPRAVLPGKVKSGGKIGGAGGMGGKGKMASMKFRRLKELKTTTGITKPAIRRIARRSGVKRIAGPVYEEVRIELENYVTKILNTAVIHSTHNKRKTVYTTDVLAAAKNHGRHFYGADA